LITGATQARRGAGFEAQKVKQPVNLLSSQLAGAFLQSYLSLSRLILIVHGPSAIVGLLHLPIEFFQNKKCAAPLGASIREGGISGSLNMAAEPLRVVVQHLRRLVGAPASGAVTDGQLLERFVHERDQAAFELLVRRHERMVWGVCRRLLREAHDAEDAFQATFLVLVRKAGTVAKKESAASWRPRTLETSSGYAV
jgi:hypothetical protein